MRNAFLLMALLLVPAVAGAQENQDAEGSKDHPLVPRLAGGQYYIGNYDAQDFGSFEFALKDDQSVTVEGKYLKIDYILKEGGKKFGPLEIVRNYLRNSIVHSDRPVVKKRAR